MILKLDQFYTKPEVALDCALIFSRYYAPFNLPLLEPAAGTGSFVRAFQSLGFTVNAFDIAPGDLTIAHGDYLKQNIRELYGRDFIKNYAVIGNMPFGNLSSTALKFFRKATSENANVIASILPKTFRKRSMINRLPLNYHLLIDIELDPESFIKDGLSYAVPSCWQIWYSDNTKLREIIPDYNISDLLIYVKDRNKADLAIQRVGRSAGRVIYRSSDKYSKLKDHSYYFVNVLDPEVLIILEAIDWSYIKAQTAGVNSIGKAEIAEQISIRLGREPININECLLV